MPSRTFVTVFFVWIPTGACLILSRDNPASSLILSVSAFRKLVVLLFVQFNCENILSTLAEECGETIILVVKYNNRENQSYRILTHHYAVKS